MNRNFYTLVLILSVLCFIPQAYAQTGIIKGVVSDVNSQAPIAGASVRIQGTSQGISTNAAGTFEFIKIEPGTYKIQVSFLGYQELTVEGIQVDADKSVDLQLELQPGGEDIEEVVISVSRLSNTNNAVISEVKTARQVISGISQQQIRLSQDRDAAQVMSRIPGLTVVDNRFVMVRGVPERYNQVMLNNAIAPSTEVDRRTFAFDLIPSGVLDRMMIYKSGSPENPGDFAGGLIKVYTTNAATQTFTSFSVGTSIRANTTFNPYIYSRTSSTDFLGFDGGERRLPADFPTVNFRDLPNADPLRIEAPKLLNNDLSYSQITAIPDFNLGFGIGRSWDLGGRRLNMLSNVSYSQSHSYFERDFSRYLIQNASDYGQPAELRSDYVDNRYERDNRVGLLSNWSFIINPFHKIEFKNLYNQLGENTAILRSGEDFNQQVGHNRQNYMYQYRSRSIYSGQLEGTHRFDAGLSSLNWVLGVNRLGENQPDLRRFRTVETAPGSGIYRMLLPSSSNLYDTGRYFGELTEISLNNGVNYERVLKGGGGEDAVLLKAGYLLDYRTREFSSRYFSYRAGSDATSDDVNQLELLPLDQIFANQNFGNRGFSVEEGTSPRDSYDASNFLSAGYLGLVYPLGDFLFSGGARLEYNILTLSSGLDTGAPIEVDNRVFSPLGFLNVDYSVNEGNKIRAGYGRTVNRPEFREVAPFLFYDYEFDLNRYGQPDLKTATIDNFDIRYEIYPRQGETISLGGFYKRITNPIETTIIPQGESPSFGFTNALGGAFNYGVEIEIRKSFNDITSSAFVDRLSVNLNASYIKSEVNYGDEAIGQDRTRPLQGQSPYIANAVLSYDDTKNGWQISGAYNVLGPRIFAIGNLQFPAIYELPRNAVDLTVTKSFRNNISLKLGVQDLLNAPYRFYQDTDRNQRIDTSRDDVVFNFRRGSLFTSSITYTIK